MKCPHFLIPSPVVILLLTLTTPAHAAPKAGDVDPTFTPGTSVDGTVYSVVVQPDGKVLIGGEFNYIGGLPRFGVARLDARGNLDNGFLNGLAGTGPVFSLALQSDGRVLIGGYFDTVNGSARGGIARLNIDGTLDTGFEGGMAGADLYYCYSTECCYICQSHQPTIRSMAVQTNGNIFAGGAYTRFNQVTHNGITSLNTNGSVNTTFQDYWTGASYPTVYSLATQPDGKVIIGGDFGITRLNPDGHHDAGFPSVTLGGGHVFAVALQSGGKVVIGGDFTSVNGTNRNYIARLNTNGTLDTSFQNGMSGADSSVFALTVQPDNKVLMGGEFYYVNSAARSGIARLNVDGSLDTNFLNGMAGTDDSVASIGLQPDGNILIGGFFANVNGVGSAYVARLYGKTPLSIGNVGIVANHLGFDVTGESNQVVVVEGSTNLLTWTALKTNSLSAGVVPFTDPVSASLPRRFYRVRLQ